MTTAAPRPVAAGAGHSAASMRVMTRFAARTASPDVVRSRSQASHDVAVSIASRYSARAVGGSAVQLGAEGGLEVLEQQAVGRRHGFAHAGRGRRPAHQGTPDRRDLLEEGGPVADDRSICRSRREPGRPLGHVGPLAAQLQGGDEVVEVVHVGEVVEDEAERHPGPLGHGPRRRVRVAGAQQLHQGLGDVAAGPLSPGQPAVGGRLLGGPRRSRSVVVDRGRETGRGEAEADARLARSAGRLRGAGGHWETFLSVWESNGRLILAPGVHDAPGRAGE